MRMSRGTQESVGRVPHQAQRCRLVGYTGMKRWLKYATRSISGSEPARFVEPGVFTRPFAMRRTVILEIELAPLDLKPPQKEAVEIAVVTGRRVSDGAVISTNYIRGLHVSQGCRQRKVKRRTIFG